MRERSVRGVLLDVAMLAASQVALYYTFRYIMNKYDPQNETHKEAKDKSEVVLGRLGLKDIKLTSHEEVIASQLVHPDDITVRFEDVAGLDGVVSSLRETVIYPLCYPSLYSSSNLLSAPKGVLLYGPPGCGKTMLAKALAKESGATFINISASVLTDKWFGESNKLVKGLFSLARKLQPTIIFLDEIDTFLRDRGKGDHEAMGMVKAEFMTLWDGLASGDNTRILVLGATNRPNDIDAAFLRRMPKRFAIGLPDATQRRKILEVLLRTTQLDPSLDLSVLVEHTEGFSGSDLKEQCRSAAMTPLRQYLRERGGRQMVETVANAFQLRPLRLEDFFASDVTEAGESGPLRMDNTSSLD